VDFLERYIYLILYNTYVAEERASGFSRPFSRWMQEVCLHCNLCIISS
jgi:hypothetical protein